MGQQQFERLEGIAASCLAGIAAGVLLTEHNVSPSSQWYVWGLFIIVCGLVISPPQRFRAKCLLAASLPAAVCLILTMLARGAISILMGASFAAVASMELTPAQMIQAENLRRVAGIYLIILVGTVPAV